MVGIAFAFARANINESYNSQLVKRGLGPGLATALYMAHRYSANYFGLDYHSPYELYYLGTVLTMYCFVASYDLANRAASILLAIFGAL